MLATDCSGKQSLRRCAIWIAALCFLWSVGIPLAEGQIRQAEESLFEVDAVNVQAEVQHRTRVDLYARVSYAGLRFLNTADGFTARYTVSVEAHRLGDSNDRQYVAARRSWEQSITEQNYASTRSAQRFDRSAQSLELRPGRYLLVYQLEDAATNAVRERTMPLTVRSMDAPVALSGLILLDDFDAASNTITPRISSDVGTNASSLQFFYELYADAPQQVRVRRTLVRTERSRGLPVIGTLLGGGGERDRGEITYTQVEARTLSAGRTPTAVNVPLNDVRVGEYLIRVQVEDEQGRVLDEAEKAISMRWTGLYAHIRNLDEAINQLRYIAKERDLEHIRSGATEEERLERFEAFWEKRNPTPGTARNERMEEYYYRVARANRSYSREQGGQRTAGWQTDRGHVLVLFGEPDRVEQRPYSAESRPYEVWHYERISRQFVFVEDSGAYKLVEPIWDEQSRIR